MMHTIKKHSSFRLKPLPSKRGNKPNLKKWGRYHGVFQGPHGEKYFRALESHPLYKNTALEKDYQEFLKNPNKYQDIQIEFTTPEGQVIKGPCKLVDGLFFPTRNR